MHGRENGFTCVADQDIPSARSKLSTASGQLRPSCERTDGGDKGGTAHVGLEGDRLPDGRHGHAGGGLQLHDVVARLGAEHVEARGVGLGGHALDAGGRIDEPHGAADGLAVALTAWFRME